MANDINRVTLVGRLTRDPEFKSINGTSLVNFSLANGRTYVSNGEKREESHFFDCEVWGKPADIIQQYCKKGKQIAIEGRLKQDTWETPEGKKASRIRIVVENFQLLGSKDDSNSMSGSSSGGSSTFGGNSSSPESYNPPAPDGDDDIPF
ncbi:MULTISPECIES: single-stranded DNA-binding protein [Leptospira]|uniref:Single-stranded DNA-binding protein n=2 Tax=Leptospira borgpetersenii TaxID=174 RepID=A0A0E3B1P9_LEPBO|nr:MULTISPECIES: single-stranded DNA-binding protein [Leptospira]ABJ75798.1 Single-stranded DNA-binding protein [Leptospira borgpetersenii serovar Hardjo-bovis str. JB197]ABJ78744.1 Single-stranded DNA-binding protein [Leptospira borgpetersenii serovar Hardjo-bovis str. L550]ALO25961.1 single-stranded DNA-binding protein [Leptospira borgpetersenii serovar Ballum]AMX58011.1 single-stranded DNA-binding protein [Leptospira borgpetersenii serovar Hardjo]AMX61263.1 single-stranded DNA-binding prote